MVFKVDIHPGPDTPRHDNKELDPEKAEEIVEHMTEEQKEKLREVMKCRASGGCHYAPGTARPTTAKPTTQSYVHVWYCGTYHSFDRHDIGIEQLQFPNNQCYVVPVRLSLRSYATGLN